MQAKRVARALAKLSTKPSETFSDIFSNPSLGSVDPNSHSSVCGRLGLMAEHSAPGLRQVRTPLPTSPTQRCPGVFTFLWGFSMERLSA